MKDPDITIYNKTKKASEWRAWIRSERQKVSKFVNIVISIALLVILLCIFKILW